MTTDAIDMSSALWDRLAQLGFPIEHMDEDAAIAALAACQLTFTGDVNAFANQDSDYEGGPTLDEFQAAHPPKVQSATPYDPHGGAKHHFYEEN